MKRSTCLIMISALFLVGSLALVRQTSAAEKTPFTATDSFDPFNLLGNGNFGTILLPLPTITCPGGELKDPPPPAPWLNPCTDGSRVHTRGFKIQTVFTSSNPLVNGVATITINANFDADGNGPAWGTISIAPDAGGTWDGVWEGIHVWDDNLNQWVIPVHASLRGTGGGVDGMLYRAVDTIVTPYFVVFAYEGEIVGTILDPHSN